MGRRGVASAGAGLVGAAVLVLTGCASPAPAASSYCVPLVHVRPAKAAPGDRVTVSVDDGCDRPMPAGGWRIVAAPVGRPERAVATRVSGRLRDGLSADVTLPATFPAGAAFAGIADWDSSLCDDGGGSCASPTADFTVSGATR